MTVFRVETETDPHSGKVFARVHRDPGGELLAESGAIFASAQEAEDKIVAAIANAWPAVPADPVYPAGGS